MRLLFLSLIVFTSAFSVQAAQEPIVPKIKIEFWNQFSHLRLNNNCYNYSTNRVTNDFAQPGDASNSIFTDLSCEDVYGAASKDLGLNPTKFYRFNGKKDATLIALVVWPGNDFHWYRRDDNGLWSHKIGSDPASNKDSSGKIIEDPVRADRGDYTRFCGYFKVENFPEDQDEQNAGYVRIGGMSDLPGKKKAKSEVFVNLYSGRKNPRLSLRELLENKELKALLQNFQAQSMRPSIQSVFEEDILSGQFASITRRLGYRGLIINDVEGLLFPAGSVVSFHGQVGRLENDFRGETYFKTDLGLSLERAVNAEFKKSGVVLPEL